MKKLADFIVNKSKLVLTVMLVITAVCVFLATTVETNKDMTKYLSEDTNMQQGLTIMKAWFEEDEEKASIRVMFDDLDEAQRSEVQEKLESIPHVSSVDYDEESEDYNKANHMLFVVNTKYDYDTDEELAIEQALSVNFSEYSMAFANNDVKSAGVSFGLLASALSILLVILFIMSESWLEPVLFMATTGIAVVINLGTNIIFPYTAELTGSIAPILQLALSMDYSIMLMNRYRQEKKLHNNNTAAMQAALANSVASIASSSITTVVGLLALVFLTFKLGPELGIILAKGVFISMLCVFTILPILILRFDRGIEKSRKKSPHIPMGLLTRFSYRARFIMPVIFLALFVAFYIMQSKTGITFSETMPDTLADVFPRENTVVMLYNTEDEENTEQIIKAVEDNVHVKSLIGYRNTIGEKRTAADMADAIAELSDSVDVDAEMIRMLYYLYYEQEAAPMRAEAFLKFIRNDVLESDTLSEYIDESMKENTEYLDKFSSKESLTKKMSMAEMADFFEIDYGNIKDLYLYYFTENGGVDTGSMDVSTFADYVINTVAENEDYSSMFDAAALSQMETMRTYTDKEAMTRLRGYRDTAAVLAMGEEEAKLIYVYCFAKHLSYAPSRLQLTDYVDFMLDDVAKNDMFSSYLGSNDIKQMQQLETYMDSEALQRQLSMENLASKLGMDADDAERIYVLYQANNPDYTPDPMTLADFVAYMQTVADTPMFSAYIDASAKAQVQQLAAYTDLNAMRTPLPISDLASFLGMNEASARMIYTYHTMQDPNDTPTGMTLAEFVAFMQSEDVQNTPALASQIDAEKIAQLAAFTNPAALTIPMSSDELTGILGVDVSNILDATVASPSDLPARSIKDAVNSILSLPNIATMLDDITLVRLASLQNIIAVVEAGTVLSGTELATAMGMPDPSGINAVLIYRDSATDAATMSIEQAVSFILSNDGIRATLDTAALAQMEMLNGIIAAVGSDAAHSYQELASLLGMDAEIIKMMLILPDSDGGTLSLEQAVSFILSNDTIRNTLLTSEIKELERLQKIIRYVLDSTYLSYMDIADFVEMDADDAKLLLTYRDAQGGAFEYQFLLSVQQVINFIVDNSSTFRSQMGDDMENIKTAQKLINAAVNETRYDTAGLAKLLEMDRAQVEDLFLLYISDHGDMSGWKLSPQGFVAFTVNKVLPDDAFSDNFDADTTEELKNGKLLIDAIVSEETYSPARMSDLLSGLSSDITQADVEMLYFYYAGLNSADNQWRMTIPEMFDFLCDEVMTDARFSSMFDRQTKNDLLSQKADLNNGIAQMKGKEYSRLIFTTDYPEESEETTAFMASLDHLRKQYLDNDSYMIGTSAMVYEMGNSFKQEFTIISIITAVAIFLVVLLAFRNAFVSALLTLLVQCGVFITVAVIDWRGQSIYYLALLIVQSILMGATIDYGIVFCSYYREGRAACGKKRALKTAYDGSIHTIMTSGSILILVTAILGMFSTDAITSQVCITISIGSLVATLLILLVLPGILVALDRFIAKSDRKKVPENGDAKG